MTALFVVSMLRSKWIFIFFLPSFCIFAFLLFFSSICLLPHEVPHRIGPIVCPCCSRSPLIGAFHFYLIYIPLESTEGSNKVIQLFHSSI
jgi:hypothetical protein